MACVIAAEGVRAESSGTANHANRLKWAATVFNDPVVLGGAMTWAVIAQKCSVYGSSDRGSE
jgi:hypothetical protein